MISIIIPSYKRELYIEESIKSIMEQTYNDWEILIIDDGSTDATVDICRFMSRTDPRIRLFNRRHRGVSAARNIGLEEARGEYVFFMDSDDMIHPCLLSELVRIIEETGVNAVSCGLRTVTNEQLTEPEFTDFDLSETITDYSVIRGEGLIRELFQSKQQIGAIGGKMFRKSAIENISFNRSIHKGEDTFFIYEYAINGGDFCLCRKDWYFYRRHSTNVSHITKQNVNDDSFYHANTLMYENEKKRGNDENARLLKKHISHNMRQLYTSAREQEKYESASRIKHELLRMMLHDKEKAATPKRWVAFIALVYFYPVHKTVKKMLHK